MPTNSLVSRPPPSPPVPVPVPAPVPVSELESESEPVRSGVAWEVWSAGLVGEDVVPDGEDNGPGEGDKDAPDEEESGGSGSYLR
jgi:hypothetical protein